MRSLCNGQGSVAFFFSSFFSPANVRRVHHKLRALIDVHVRAYRRDATSSKGLLFLLSLFVFRR